MNIIEKPRSQKAELINSSPAVPPSADHLRRMLTDIGIWQHSIGLCPDEKMGYSIDDEARGLIVGMQNWKLGFEKRLSEKMIHTCFEFVATAQCRLGENNGRFHNFCDKNAKWLDSIGSDDSFGRTIWSLGAVCAMDLPVLPATEASSLLRRSMPIVERLEPPHLRSAAFVILGLAACSEYRNILRVLSDRLADSYEAHSSAGWRWFQNHMTYCNARLPQAMLLASVAFPNDTRYRQIGTESLDFLLSVTRSHTGGYAPIGNAPMEAGNWFSRGSSKPPLFDQQPVDTGALVECCSTAYSITGDPRYRVAANAAYGWYFGDNVHGLPIYNPHTGAVADALTRVGINRNNGAESILSIHLAYQALNSIAT